MTKAILAGLAVFAVALSGCSVAQDNGEVCAQVITPAIGPDGACKEFPTPCDVPNGYRLVDSCEVNGDVEEEPVEDPAPEPEPGEENILEEIFPPKYDFKAELKFCEYNSLLKKTTMFYQIRNQTENRPTYGAKIWLKVPELDYGQAKTIQNRYDEGRLLWEEQSYDHVSHGRLRGQFWEIRNLDSNGALDFSLIYCEPEAAQTKDACTPQTGIVIVEGDTGELCA